MGIYCNNPAGTWETSDIIGSECKIVAISLGYSSSFKDLNIDSDATYTITNVVHHVSEDGKIYPAYVLDGLEGKLWKSSEIYITKIKISDGN